MRRICSAVILACLGYGAAAWAEPPEVTIDPGGVPPEALQAIVGAVDAITRLADDQDGGEVSRLRRRARDATLSALETQGYFSSVVNLEVGEDILGETWDITIQPGKRTTVGSVDLQFFGQIDTPAFEERMLGLRRDWPLTKGMPFINAEWSSAKTELLDGVRRKDFYLAHYRRTQATVVADEATAELEAIVDSGPRVRMGEMEVEGLTYVPESLIERYVVYQPGDPYDQDLLDEWQQSLQSTSFFRGAFVQMDDTPAHHVMLPGDEIEMPVRIRLTEAPRRRYNASLGVDSDNGVRVEGLYRQNILMGQPVWLETGAGIDKNRRRAFYDVHFAPTRSGYRHSVGLLYNYSDISGVTTTRYGLGWKLAQARKAAGDSRVEYETSWGAVLAHDDTDIDGGDSFRVPTLVGTWQWLRRDVNNKYDPREGWLLDVGLGAGVTLDKREPFYRASTRVQKWWAIGRYDVLSVRGEVGKVWSKTNRLPEDFGYRTGGGRSLRGYKYQSIGLHQGNATVGAPALAVFGIEYIRYFTEQIGMAVFVDVGDAAESFRDMEWHAGYGIGGRVRTPAGPFGIDLAYGQRDHNLRLHFSLGIAF
ncbi:BamA/TamA family outer membrane protein [Pusillimonas sp. CC-YST705]|uniref:BamA/TamA family outer membrane protein n=1 Tax=Mesopusillimonas faecipullorum TaxID=2755040 RepID=A0ABS8CCT3_9BURK|nr:BamA/TamA family outer membrane protein [Mesopusillimonas faecipullorum]MCB5363840.1 BamA/TamA family outer membrane protein [Mesopusillimonas faecipullorum]